MGRFHADSHIWLKVKSIEQIHTVERIYEHFPRPSSHKTQIDVSSVKLFVLVATFWKIFQGRHLLEKKALLEGNLSKIPITCHPEIIFSQF